MLSLTLTRLVRFQPSVSPTLPELEKCPPGAHATQLAIPLPCLARSGIAAGSVLPSFSASFREELRGECHANEKPRKRREIDPDLGQVLLFSLTRTRESDPAPRRISSKV